MYILNRAKSYTKGTDVVLGPCPAFFADFRALALLALFFLQGQTSTLEESADTKLSCVRL